MNLKKEFNRIGHLFNGGVEKTQHEAGQWVGKGAKQADKMSRQIRERAGTRRRQIITFEEALVKHVRENPALYVFAAALLLGVLIARLVLESRRTSRAPLL